MPQYARKTPIMVDAIQFVGDNYDAVYQFTGSGRINSIKIDTPVGIAVARAGDWIVKDDAGSFWRLPDALFRTVYDASQPI